MCILLCFYKWTEERTCISHPSLICRIFGYGSEYRNKSCSFIPFDLNWSTDKPLDETPCCLLFVSIRAHNEDLFTTKISGWLASICCWENGCSQWKINLHWEKLGHP